MRREGVQGEALRPAGEGDEWSAATDRSLLAGDVGAIGEAASQRASSCVASGGSSAAVAGSLSLSATRGDSGDVEGFVVEGNAMARRVGGAGMRDGTAAASVFFPLMVGSAGRASAATRWAHSTTSAYSGRESSSGRALKSLSCARQASRSASWRPAAAGEGGDIRFKSVEVLKEHARGNEGTQFPTSRRTPAYTELTSVTYRGALARRTRGSAARSACYKVGTQGPQTEGRLRQQQQHRCS